MNFEQAVFSGYYLVLPLLQLVILQITTEILQTRKALTFSVWCGSNRKISGCKIQLARPALNRIESCGIPKSFCKPEIIPQKLGI